MARTANDVEKQVDLDLFALALAKAVADGDIVNLRFLFGPFSPARKTSPERFEDGKYQYLLPAGAEEQERPAFRAAQAIVRRPEVWDHSVAQLEKVQPAQIPHELVLELGDAALRAGKYSSAAQAYEVLRIRSRMQDEVLKAADAALDAGDTKRAVRGYLAAAGLGYDYAAFPEPLPKVANFQTTALMLHGDYPQRPGDRVGLRPPGPFASTALQFLLNDDDIAGRLGERPLEQRQALVAELVRALDPGWEDFVGQYAAACDMLDRFQRSMRRGGQAQQTGGASLADEIDDLIAGDPAEIQACLLGREIEDGEWWQYLKELAYAHPAAALFVTRQMIGEREVIVPCHRPDSPLAQQLALPDQSVFAALADTSGGGEKESVK